MIKDYALCALISSPILSHLNTHLDPPFLDATNQSGTPRQKVITYISWIDFFFPLQPKKYWQWLTHSVSTPFQLQQMQLCIRITHHQDTTFNTVVANFVSLLLKNIKIVSRENKLDTEKQVVQGHVKWQTSSAMLNTFYFITPKNSHHLQSFMKATSGYQCLELKLQRYCRRQSIPLDRMLSWNLNILSHGQCVKWWVNGTDTL